MKSINYKGATLDNTQDEERTATFIASDSTKDRHGTVVNQLGWSIENFNLNGIIGYQHNVYGNDMCQEKATPDDVIGKGNAFVEDGKLKIKVTFKPEGRSEQADKVWLDVRDGFLNAVSVGFLELGEGKFGEGEEARGAANQTYYYAGQELLEVSVVNIPSNPRALKKSLRDSTANALMFAKRTLGEGYSFTDIEKMTVGDLIRKLENPEEKQAAATVSNETTTWTYSSDSTAPITISSEELKLLTKSQDSREERVYNKRDIEKLKLRQQQLKLEEHEY